MAHPIEHISKFNEYVELINNNACVVKFTAQWCGPCKKIAPLYEKLATENSEFIKFLEVDIDPSPEITRFESIQAVPRFEFYYHGTKLEQFNFSGGNSTQLANNIKAFSNQVDILNKQNAEIPQLLPQPVSNLNNLISSDVNDSDSSDYSDNEYSEED